MDISVTRWDIFNYLLKISNFRTFAQQYIAFIFISQ